MKNYILEKFLFLKYCSLAKHFLIAVIFFMITALNAAIYVKSDGDDANDGVSWASAKATIANAITNRGAETEVHIAGGDYLITQTITVPTGVKLIGGFSLNGDNTRPLASANTKPWDFKHKTVVKGPNHAATWSWNAGLWTVSAQVGTLNNLATINGEVDGISFTGAVGVNTASTGITLSGGTLKNSIVKNNYRDAQAAQTDPVCGILVTDHGNPQILNSYIGENLNLRSNSLSSIIYVKRAGTIIDGCLINQNSYNTGAGGIVRIDSSNCVVRNTVFVNNYVNFGGHCVWAVGVEVDVENCLIANNSQKNSSNTSEGNMGSPVFKASGSASARINATNCTIVNNKRLDDNNRGTIAHLLNGSSLNLVNCIMWGNTGNGTAVANPLVTKNASNAVTITNCAFDTTLTTNGTATGSINLPQATANAPLFVTSSLLAAGVGATQIDCNAIMDYNLNLLFNSPCRDAGTAVALASDIAGVSRPQGLGYDIGAYEYYKIVYVKEDGDDANDGLSWANAKATVQAAINTSDVTSVYVAGGNYYPTETYDQSTNARKKSIVMKSGVNVYGGFSGTEVYPKEREMIDRNNNGMIESWEFKYETILDGNITKATNTWAWDNTVDKGWATTGNGNNSYHVVWFGSNVADATTGNPGAMSAKTVLDGVTVKNGCANRTPGAFNHDAGGGGAYLRGNAVIQNCYFTQNTSVGNIAGGFAVSGTLGGGAVLCDYGGEVYSSCFEKNSAGGTVAGTNATNGTGAAICLRNGGIVDGAVCYNNSVYGTGGPGAGVIAVYGAGAVNNAVVFNNTVGYGAMVSYVGTSATSVRFNNCTVANNYKLLTNQTNHAAGIATGNGTSGEWTNCLVFGNTAKNSASTDQISAGNMVNCKVSAGQSSVITSAEFVNPASFIGGEHNIPERVAEIAASSYAVKPTSPCFNAGTGTNAPTKDVLGNMRPQYGAVDIGAYEWKLNPQFATADNALYVSSTGAGNYSGDSWTNALPAIALGDAINTSGLKEIHLTGETYTMPQGITLPAGVKMYGGYTVTNGVGTRPLVTNPIGSFDFLNKTIIQRDPGALAWNDVTGIQFTASAVGAESVVDGIVTRNYGPGVRMADNTHLVNSIVRDNRRNSGNDFIATGLSLLNTTNVRVKNCMITANDGNGGWKSTIDIQYANGIVENTLITENVESGANNRLISAREGEAGRGSLHFINCNIVKNTNQSNGMIQANDGTKFTNCVFWGNSTFDMFKSARNYGTYTNCATDIENSKITLNLSIDNMADLMSPKFQDPANLNYHVLANSPLINAGDAIAGLASTDLIQAPRVWNASNAGKPDIGVYELQQKGIVDVVYTDTVYNKLPQAPIYSYSNQSKEHTPSYSVNSGDANASLDNGIPITAGTYVVSYPFDDNWGYNILSSADSTYVINKATVNTIIFNKAKGFNYTVDVESSVDMAVTSSTATPKEANPVSWTYSYSNDNWQTSSTFVPAVEANNVGAWLIKAIPNLPNNYKFDNTPLGEPCNEWSFSISASQLPRLTMKMPSTIEEGAQLPITFNLESAVSSDIDLAIICDGKDFYDKSITAKIPANDTIVTLNLPTIVAGFERTTSIDILLASASGVVQNDVPPKTTVTLITSWEENGIRFFTTMGRGHKTGKTWDSAADSTQLSIISQASVSTAYFAGGEYDLKASLSVGSKKLYGGFAGTETDLTLSNRQKQPNSESWEFTCPTMFIRTASMSNSENMMSVMLGGEIDGVMLDGKNLATSKRGAGIEFWEGGTVRNSIVKNANSTNALGGGGMSSNHTNIPNVLPLIENCLITTCQSSNFGGGLSLNTPTRVIGCSIVGNTTTGNGGGIYIGTPATVIDNCNIYSNISTGTYGGGICLYGASAANADPITISHSKIMNNKADGSSSYGGGIAADGAMPSLVVMNTIIAHNHAKTYGGGLGSGSSGAAKPHYFINCTVVRNTIAHQGANASGAWYPGLHAASGTGTNCINTVIWGNVDVGGAASGQATIGTTSYSAVEGATMGGDFNLNLTSTNTGDFLSPCFKNPSTHAGFNSTGDVTWQDADWALLPTSVLINRGTKSSDIDYETATDITGIERRQQKSYVDIGAYESSSKGNVEVSVTVSKKIIFEGGAFPAFTITQNTASPVVADSQLTGIPTDSNTPGFYTIGAELVAQSFDDWTISKLTSATFEIKELIPVETIDDETPIFITLGQSNADGWGAPWSFDYDEEGLYNDMRFPNKIGLAVKQFYSTPKSVELKMFFKSMKGQALTDDVAVPYDKTWLDLHYQTELENGKTTMIARQNLGTGTNAAKYTRAMEAPFGYYWSMKEGQNKPLYFIKATAGGSNISQWLANGQNWTYFKNNIYKPAIDKLVEQGKKPRLVGIWWMQGESNITTATGSATYGVELEKFAAQIRSELGFPEAKLFVGSISGAGYINSGNQGQDVYDAQKTFCQNSKNNAVFIDNQSLNRRFHGAMTVADVLPSPPLERAPYYTMSANYNGVTEAWTGTPAYQKDDGSSNPNGHYTAGAQAEIAKEIFDGIGSVESWDGFATVGQWRNLIQIFNSEDQILVQDVIFDPALPTINQGVLIEYEINGIYSKVKPTQQGVYNVKAIIDYGSWKDVLYSKLKVLTPIENVYVRSQGEDGAGSSWDDALSDIQVAIECANLNTPKGVVHIEGGKYTLTQPLELKGVTLIGSYKIENHIGQRPLLSKPEGLWDYESKTTILSPNKTFASINGETLDGLECIAISNSEINFVGGTIQNSILQGQGLGVSGSNATYRVIGTKIHSNSTAKGAIGNFGGVFSGGSGTVDINNCLITNINGTTGVIFFANSAITINLSKTLIYKNNSTGGYSNYGGPIGIYGGTVLMNVINCTIVDNTATASSSGALFRHSGTLNVKNTIMWNNKTSAAYSGTMTLENCAFDQSVFDGSNPGDSDAQKNIHLSSDNANPFGPRFSHKTLGEEPPANAADINPQYLLGSRSILINRAMRLTP